MKYIYNKDLNLIETTFDNIDDEDIKRVLGNEVIIANTEYENPILDSGIIREMNADELAKLKYKKYKKREYILEPYEIVKGSKVIPYDLGEFEYIEDGKVKYDIARKRESLKYTANRIKHDKLEYGFIFKDNLRQPCREQDKTSITAIVVQANAFKLKGIEWKFFDKDTNEHIYVAIPINELINMGMVMAKLTTDSMKAESTIIKEIDKLDEEQLKSYNVAERFDELLIS